MRNLNGYGGVVKLGGNRRKPFAVRVTSGWTDDGKQIMKYVSYHETRRDALIALAEYNKNPYDLDAGKLTFKDVFEAWEKEQTGRMEPKNLRSYRSAYKNCTALEKMIFSQIKKAHLQAVIDNCPKGDSTKNKIKHVYGKLYRFALENDIVQKDYSKFVVVVSEGKKSDRKPFTEAEIKTLWKRKNEDFIKLILILIYTGFRIQELLDIVTENVHLDDKYMIGGNKTEAGRVRTIPISDKIIPFVSELMNNGNEYLVNNHIGKKMPYHTFYRKWNTQMEELGMDHKIHDTRHTTASLLSAAHCPLVVIQRILGHSSTTVTERVYIHIERQELIEWINKI